MESPFFYLQDKDTEFEDSGVLVWYMVIFNDRNNNDKVDIGELNKVMVNFK